MPALKSSRKESEVSESVRDLVRGGQMLNMNGDEYVRESGGDGVGSGGGGRGGDDGTLEFLRAPFCAMGGNSDRFRR